jgi:Holliday junction resolvase-like predicted endonuclease
LFRKEIRYAIKEMSQTVAELSQKTKELENLFTTQWGRLVETLVEGALVRIFNDWGISVNCTLTRLKGNYQGQGYEFDIIVYNGDVLIIVEVKTTLRPNDVKKFVKKLGLVKNWLPRYANNQIYGAMAFLHADAGADQMVVNKNMFAIRATGDSAHILNSKGFIPKVW